MARGILRKIETANQNVNDAISGTASGGRYASALAGEGYNGGYRDALQDVLLALNGVTPNRFGWWQKKEAKNG